MGLEGGGGGVNQLVGVGMGEGGAVGWLSSDTAGARTFNPHPLTHAPHPVLLGAALPFVIQSIIFHQNCQLHSCYTLPVCVCVCVRARVRAY